MAKKQPAQTENNDQLPEGLKSIYLELENFKNIEKTVIEINGQSMLIIGKNGSGKSTLIQAMKSPMDAKLLPSEPIKKGEERAKIIHKIGGMLNGEYKEYTMELSFSEKNKSGTLTVLNEKMEKISSPATTIKNIIGNVSFDVMGWMTAKKDKKRDMFIELSGCKEELDVINMNIKNKKADKKYKADRAEELEGVLKNHEFTTEEIDLYSQPVDMVAIQEQYDATITNQQQWDGIKNKLDSFYTAVQTSQNGIAKAQNEILRLEALMREQHGIIKESQEIMNKNQSNILKGEEWVRLNPRPVVDQVREQMNTAISHNEKHIRIGMLGNQQCEIIKLKQEVEAIKLNIDGLETKRSTILSSSPLKVPGLTISEDDIFLDGLPLESEQINTAKLIDIGMEIAMALNPKYKVIFIDDGSLLDQGSRNIIINKAHSRGYMVAMEIVGTSETPEVFFTEQSI